MDSPCCQSFRSRSWRVVPKTVLLVAIAAAVLTPSAVRAQEYPPAPTLLASPAVAVEGTVVTLTGSGFLPDAPIEIYLATGPLPVSAPAGQVPVADFAVVEYAQTAPTDGSGQLAVAAEFLQAPMAPQLGTLLGTTMSDASGSFTFRWDTSGYAPGRYTLTATDGTNTASTDVIITAASEPADVVPVRPDTGAATPTAGRSLPLTGGMSDGLVRVGIVLLTIGGLAVLASRGRWRNLLPTR
jgi:hypothetical protein